MVNSPGCWLDSTGSVKFFIRVKTGKSVAEGRGGGETGRDGRTGSADLFKGAADLPQALVGRTSSSLAHRLSDSHCVPGTLPGIGARKGNRNRHLMELFSGQLLIYLGFL